MPSDFEKFLIGLGGGASLLGAELALSLGSSLLNLIEGILQSSPETVSEVSSLLLAPAIIGFFINLFIGIAGALNFKEHGAYVVGVLTGNLVVLIGFGILFGKWMPDVVVRLAFDFFIVILPLLLAIGYGLSRGEQEYMAGGWP